MSRKQVPVKATLGVRFMLEIVAFLKNAPATRGEALMRFRGGKGKLPLRALLDLGVLRIAGWTRAHPKRGGWAIIYGVGDEPNAPPPIVRKTGKPIGGRFTRRVRPSASAIAFAALWHALKEKRALIELAEETGHGLSGTGRFIKRGRQLGLFRIASWEKHGRVNTAIFGHGSRDMPRPPRLTHEEKLRRKRDHERGRRLTISVTRALAARNRRYGPRGGAAQPEGGTNVSA